MAMAKAYQCGLQPTDGVGTKSRGFPAVHALPGIRSCTDFGVEAFSMLPASARSRYSHLPESCVAVCFLSCTFCYSVCLRRHIVLLTQLQPDMLLLDMFDMFSAETTGMPACPSKDQALPSTRNAPLPVQLHKLLC